MKLPESKWSAARYVFIFIYGYYLYKCGAPSGLRECVNGLFWLRECVKIEKKLRECVNWKDLRERENPFFYCVNAWICPAFCVNAWIFPLHPFLCKFPRFLTIFPIFSENFPDFPKNRVCVNFEKNLRECVNFENFLRECVNFGSAGGPLKWRWNLKKLNNNAMKLLKL